MRTFKLNKLVRDNIVKLHLDMEGDVKYKTLSKDELVVAILDKLVEEATELKTSDLKVGEVADLKELVDALIEHLGLDPGELATRQHKKREANGAFKKGHFIDTVSLPENNKWANYYAADPKRFPEVKS